MARPRIALAALLLLAACSSSKKGGSTDASTLKLAAGDCLVPPATVQVQLATVTKVACTAQHTQEVFALTRYAPDGGTSNDTYPGDTVLTAFADGSCEEQFQAWDGIAYPDSKLFFTYLLPSPRSWSQGDRAVVCVIQTTGAPLQATTKNSRL